MNFGMFQFCRSVDTKSVAKLVENGQLNIGGAKAAMFGTFTWTKFLNSA